MSTFRASLSSSEAPATGATVSTPRVLVIEDDPDIQLLIGYAVPDGWEVVTTANGLDGLDAVATSDPDVVVLDLGLPDIGGEEVLARLKADPVHAWRPVVVLSAILDRRTAIEVLRGGAQDALQKPVEPELLEARLVAAQRVAAGHREAESERFRREAAHRAESVAEARYRSAIDHAPMPVAEIDPYGFVLSANDALIGLLGYDPIGLSFGDLVEGDDQTERRLAEIRTKVHSGWTAQFTTTSAAGEHLTLISHASSLIGVDGEVDGVLLYLSDVTDHVARLDELTTQVDTDPLTGTLNRTGLDDLLTRMENRLEAVAVLFVDLDGFKRINDEHGHEAGDEVLRTIAQRLRAIGRADDVVCRLGGDEFLIVCPHADGRAGGGLARRVTEVVRAPIDLGDATVRVGASVGVASGQSSRVRMLVTEADAAMYEVKRAHRSVAGR